MMSEVENTINNYKENKKQILEYARLTSNENVRTGIKSFVEKADIFIETYYKIKDSQDLGEVINTDKVIYKGNEDKDMVENLKMYMGETIESMTDIYEILKNEKVNKIEEPNYELTLTSMAYTIELFELTIGNAVQDKNDDIKEIENYPKKKKEMESYYL